MGAVIANRLFCNHETVSITHKSGPGQAFANRQSSAPKGRQS